MTNTSKPKTARCPRSHPGGRPRKKLDAEQVEYLIATGHSVRGAAQILHCGENTLRRHFGAAIKRGRSLRNSNLQARQFQAAMDGNASLLIWLGKQWLHQKDKSEQDVTTRRGEPKDDFRIAGKSRAEILQDLIERLKGETAQEQSEGGPEVETRPKREEA